MHIIILCVSLVVLFVMFIIVAIAAVQNNNKAKDAEVRANAARLAAQKAQRRYGLLYAGLYFVSRIPAEVTAEVLLEQLTDAGRRVEGGPADEDEVREAANMFSNLFMSIHNAFATAAREANEMNATIIQAIHAARGLISEGKVYSVDELDTALLEADPKLGKYQGHRVLVDQLSTLIDVAMEHGRTAAGGEAETTAEQPEAEEDGSKAADDTADGTDDGKDRPGDETGDKDKPEDDSETTAEQPEAEGDDTLLPGWTSPVKPKPKRARRQRPPAKGRKPSSGRSGSHKGDGGGQGKK